MPRCQIALGGNVGDVRSTMAAALVRLRAAGCEVAAISSLYPTRAIGVSSGGDFLNAAATLDTDLAPLPLLNLLQQVERQLGRERETALWGPRPIDLDLIFYGDEVIDTERLIVPHPAAWYRRFVLDPLTEIAPDAQHPVKQETVRRLRERLLVRPLSVEFAQGLPAESDALRAEFPFVRFAAWQADAPCGDGSPEPTFVVWLGPKPSAVQLAAFPRLPRVDATRGRLTGIPFVRQLLHSALGDD